MSIWILFSNSLINFQINAFRGCQQFVIRCQIMSTFSMLRHRESHEETILKILNLFSLEAWLIPYEVIFIFSSVIILSVSLETGDSQGWYMLESLLSSTRPHYCFKHSLFLKGTSRACFNDGMNLSGIYPQWRNRLSSQRNLWPRWECLSFLFFIKTKKRGVDKMCFI